MLTILSTLVVLGVLIFVHELGHFLTAKAVGIEVPRFSIGFGPRVIGFRRGETEYVLSLLPLGGYVKMAGTEDMEIIEGAGTVNDTGTDIPPAVRTPGPRDFDAKSLPARVLVISAGVIMNVIFAFVVFSVMGMVWGVPVDPGTVLGGATEELLPAGAMTLSQITPGMRVTAVNDTKVSTRHDMDLALATARAGTAALHFDGGQTITFNLPSDDSAKANVIYALEPMVPAPAVIEQVAKGEPADNAGIKPGDKVTSVAGQSITDWSQLVSAIETNAGKPLHLVVLRDGKSVSLTVTPRSDVRDGTTFGRVGIGRMGAPPEKMAHAGPFAAIANGAERTWNTTTETAGIFVAMLTGKQSPRNLGGPIMITQLSGRVARLGMEAFLGFMAMLSVNLAVLNLLPIPVLDGGHLMFLIIEGVRGGRPVSMKSRMRWTQVGFVMIVCIMVWAIGNDLWRWIGG